MKKRLSMRVLSVLLCLGMLAGAVPAAALDQAVLDAKELYQTMGNAFHDGLMPAFVPNTWGYSLPDHEGTDYVPDMIWNYINEDLEVVDLNRGRFEEVFVFSEGLAPVFDKKTGLVGYIDPKGNLAIACQFGAYWGMGDVNVGYFREGTATVFKENYYIGDIYSSETKYWEVGEIDRTGKLVEAYHTVPAWGGDEELWLVGEGGYMQWYEMLDTTRNQSTYTTTSFETYDPLGYFDSIASEHRVHYKLENNTDSTDQVDIAVIPCVLGADFDFDGSQNLIPDRYYPLPITRIETTLEPGETVRGYFSPEWGWESERLKYVVIKLDPGDMTLLWDNVIGEWDRDSTYHPLGRTEAGNQMASDFVHKYFADYLK